MKTCSFLFLFYHFKRDDFGFRKIAVSEGSLINTYIHAIIFYLLSKNKIPKYGNYISQLIKILSEG